MVNINKIRPSFGQNQTKKKQSDKEPKNEKKEKRSARNEIETRMTTSGR